MPRIPRRPTAAAACAGKAALSRPPKGEFKIPVKAFATWPMALVIPEKNWAIGLKLIIELFLHAVVPLFFATVRGFP